MGYQGLFSTPWYEGAGGILHMEHVNVRIPAHEPAKQFYFGILGFGLDERQAHNIEKQRGVLWANIGTSQMHLPEGDPEAVRGIIGLIYADLTESRSRLESTDISGAFEGTKFSWEAAGDDDTIDVTCPYGNHFRLHKHIVTPGVDPQRLDPRGGALPSPPSLGLGIGYVHFRVKPGTAAKIGQFYREIFRAEVEDIGAKECSALGFGENEGHGAGVLVRTGPTQHIGFFESEDIPEYDGHHFCMYLSDEGFYRSFEEAYRRGLVFVSPRRKQCVADNLEQALIQKQYVIKDIIDIDSGEILHELEHEIRSASHVFFPVGRDLRSGGQGHEAQPAEKAI